ncbi:MAG: TIGR03560 family F420-dependent LLM class oxidoreductase [Actinobacteria bacterium]|nr:TIGR03560 family F420-dependent LLM class oxidoreductase [Actinomycetota bacterium]
MRFGLFVPQGWLLDLADIDPADHWPVMRDIARSADEGGWESVWVYDHFHTAPVPTDEATHEAWSLMAAFAASTSRVRLGQMCTCMGYRNPAYLAKVAATVDVISGGRVDMGIGAGWYEHEWRAYGFGFPSAGERLSMLDEGVQIMRQAWSEGVATLDGARYQVDGAIVRPLPLQSGGIPIWIAGSGEKKTLRLAARYAQYTNFDGRPDVFRRKSEVLADHCRDVGRDFGEITRSSNYTVVTAETEAGVQDRVRWLLDHYARYLDEDRVAAYRESYRTSPLVGTPEQLVERLLDAQALGMAYAITYFPADAYDRSSRELFESAVLPEFSR